MKNLEAFPGLSAYVSMPTLLYIAELLILGGETRFSLLKQLCLVIPPRSSQLLRSFCMAGSGGGEREEGCSVQLANSSC